MKKELNWGKIQNSVRIKNIKKRILYTSIKTDVSSLSNHEGFFSLSSYLIWQKKKKIAVVSRRKKYSDCIFHKSNPASIWKKYTGKQNIRIL